MSLYGIYGSHSVEACPVNNLENAKKQARISHHLTTETHDRPATTSLRLLAVLNVLSSTPARVKRRAPRTDAPLTHFASPRDEKSGLVSFAESDPAPLLAKYRIGKVLGQYHSAFDHTFVWVVEAEDPHLIEGFAIESGLASFNNLKIVPLKTLSDGVIPLIKRAHGL